MIAILYEVIDYKQGFFTVLYYKNVYDIKPVQLKISRLEIKDWTHYKYDKSGMDGKKVRLHELINKANQPQVLSPKNTPPIPVVPTIKEKKVLEYVQGVVGERTYVFAGDIKVEKISNRQVQRTIDNAELLELYDLQKVRLNKKIKEDLGIAIKGYPSIVCKRK